MGLSLLLGIKFTWDGLNLFSQSIALVSSCERHRLTREQISNPKCATRTLMIQAHACRGSRTVAPALPSRLISFSSTVLIGVRPYFAMLCFTESALFKLRSILRGFSEHLPCAVSSYRVASAVPEVTTMEPQSRRTKDPSPEQARKAKRHQGRRKPRNMHFDL